MKKPVRIVLMIIGAFVLVVVGLISYVKIALPNVGAAPDIKITSTPELIARGKYLAHSVAVCMDCHSSRDWSHFSGPPVEGTWGMGGEKFDQKMGFPGSFTAKNITPASLKTWTDGEIYRAITAGVSKDGKPLFSIMPHPNYGKLDTKDIYAIIAYIRTLKPIENKVAPSVADFPMTIILNLIPQKATPQARPDTSDKIAYGKYLFTAASCTDCHTKMDKGKPIEGMRLAGGFEFKMPTGTVRSANITPEVETGIGGWTEDVFVNRFRLYADSSYKSPKIGKGEFNTIMPWMMYGQMSKSDLAAIFAYLKTEKPIKNKVEHFTAL